MMIRKHLSPAFVVSLIALFVALSGTAVAAGIVPLATRALTADRAKQAAVADVAKKLGPQATAAMVQQAGQSPGPASSAAGLVSVKTAAFSLGPDQQGDVHSGVRPGREGAGRRLRHASAPCTRGTRGRPATAAVGRSTSRNVSERGGDRDGLRGMSPLVEPTANPGGGCGALRACDHHRRRLARQCSRGRLRPSPGRSLRRAERACRRCRASSRSEATLARLARRPARLGLRRAGDRLRVRRVPAGAGVAAGLGRLLRGPAARRRASARDDQDRTAHGGRGALRTAGARLLRRRRARRRRRCRQRSHPGGDRPARVRPPRCRAPQESALARARLGPEAMGDRGRRLSPRGRPRLPFRPTAETTTGSIRPRPSPRHTARRTRRALGFRSAGVSSTAASTRTRRRSTRSPGRRRLPGRRRRA